MGTVVVSPSSLRGSVLLPPSKSHTMRALVLAAMANGISLIHNPLRSPDTDAMIFAISGLGAECGYEDDYIYVRGVGGKLRPKISHLDVGNSGLVLRFAAALYAQGRAPVTITGDDSICHRRSVESLADGLRQLGARVEFLERDGFAPFRIQGPIHSGDCWLEAEESQPLSALLLSLPFLKGGSTVAVGKMGERPWIEMTLSWLSRVGIKVIRKENEFLVPGGQRATKFSYTIPADMSALAFMVAAALLTDSDVQICGIDPEQGDYRIIDYVQRMGASVSFEGNTLRVKGPQKLFGIELDINETVNALPVVSILAAHAKGPSRLYNGSIYRNKESDRIAAMAHALSQMGIRVSEESDGLTIFGGQTVSATLDGMNDHRIAMALALTGLRKKMKICGVSCVKKSFPGFFSTLRSLGAEIETA